MYHIEIKTPFAHYLVGVSGEIEVLTNIKTLKSYEFILN
jgi:hypothetical protein